MNFRRHAFLLLATTFVAGQAVAADLPRRSAPPIAPMAVAMNWSGFYGGVHAGWGFSQFSTRDMLAPIGGYFTLAGPAAGQGFGLNGNGVLGGLQIGYQHQYSNNVVVGVEISGALADMKKRIVSPYFPASDRISGKVDGLVTGTIKLGYAVNSFLPYIKAGYAGGHTKFLANDTVGNVSFRKTNYHHGWTVGAGVDYAVTRNLIVGVEYGYADLGRITRNGNRSNGGPERYREEVAVHSVMLRVNYLFGGPATAVVAKY